MGLQNLDSSVQIRLPPSALLICRCGGIGRRAGLKILCPHGRVGSTPTIGIGFVSSFRALHFLWVRCSFLGLFVKDCWVDERWLKWFYRLILCKYILLIHFVIEWWLFLLRGLWCYTLSATWSYWLKNYRERLLQVDLSLKMYLFR